MCVGEFSPFPVACSIRTVGVVPELLLRVRDLRGHPDDVSTVASRDVVVSIDPEHRVGELVVAVSEHLGHPLLPTQAMLGLVRTGYAAHPDDLVSELGLLSGDNVVLGPLATTLVPPPSIPERAWALDITAGPDSGRSFVLRGGSVSVGRSSHADIVLGDPSVSRRHAVVTLDRDGAVTVTADAAASNGVTIDDSPVVPAEPVGLRVGSVLALGGTRAVVRPFERRRADHLDRPDGLRFGVDFHRTPYRPPVVRDRKPKPVGPIPKRPEPRRLQLIAVVAPLIAGVAMYAMTGQAQFLLFTLISPVVMVGTAVDDRRTGRRNHRRRLSQFRDMLVERRAELEQLRSAERDERLRAAPDLAELARRAELRTIDLWGRGREAPDFLRVRIGLGDDTVSFPVELERDGDDELRAEANEALSGVDLLPHVPVTVDLATDVFGVHGDDELVAGVAASIVIQAATLHSPDDLTMVAAIDQARGLDWMKWLPHLRSVTSPVGGGHIATTHEGADALVAQLLEVAMFRTADQRRQPGHHEPQWPRVVAVLDADLRPDPASTARLLDLAGPACISVVWLAPTAAAVPRQATRILRVEHGVGARMDGLLWSTDPAVVEREVEVEHLQHSVAERAAVSLAPVRDASTASLATSIPRTAPLLDVLGSDELTTDRVAATWQQAAASGGAHHLRFPIGFAADGPLELDLVADGPHTLIGGTSGAGKSELLQSMVASLAANHSPERLNFLFVDYKGGASSQVFERLPHTVGYVTNLSADLSVRALTSLRAELDRRMALMEGRAKDLPEMLERHPDEAPASLVIIVDEFATLAKEVPEFVAGVVDIAQRGRSLGIHLVLATQRPSGSVNENILANTNLRISLRVLDRSESTAILDSPEAADIPVPLRGRGLVRLGPRHLVEFQSSFAGAAMTRGDERHPVRVGTFDRPDAAPVASTTVEDAGATHLDVVLDAIADANERLQLSPSRRPWRDVLPEVITLDALWESASPGHELAGLDAGRHVVIGMLDQPESQDQRPAVVDLEESGGLLIHGSGGTGKTTALRTIAAALDRGGDRPSVATVVFDFASRGLSSLRQLPSVVDVATGDDLEAVTRHLVRLDAELDRRRRLLAQHGAEHLSAFRRDHPDQHLDRIVVLIDGFGGLAAALLDAGGSVATAGVDRWAEIVQRILVDGRQVGIHAVVTTDRRNVVPPRLQSSIGARLVLRHADPQSYADLGIRADAASGLEATAGRALLDGRVTVQIAVVSADPSARAQADAIAELSGTASDAAPHPLASAALPDSVTDDHVDGASDAAAPTAAVVGVADISLAPATLEVEWSHAVVVGASRSGRSTALAAFVHGASDAAGLSDPYVVGPSSSPLAALGLPEGRAAFGRADDVGALLDRVANLAAVAASDERIVLVVDDIDGFDDAALAPVWERLVASDAVRIVAALETRSMVGYTTNAAVTELRRARRMLVLQPDDPSEFLQLTGVKLPVRPGLAMVPGRGVLLVDRQPSIVQIAQRSPRRARTRTPAAC